jgi:hypothetical protein
MTTQNGRHQYSAVTSHNTGKIAAYLFPAINKQDLTVIIKSRSTSDKQSVYCTRSNHANAVDLIVIDPILLYTVCTAVACNCIRSDGNY